MVHTVNIFTTLNSAGKGLFFFFHLSSVSLTAEADSYALHQSTLLCVMIVRIPIPV